MECATLFSPLVMQSRETSSEFGFRERRVRPLCHLLIRQQTWQEIILSVVVAKLSQVRHAAARSANTGG
jgi:hypothetical protein